MAFDRGTARLHLASSAPEGDETAHALVIRQQPVDEWYKDQGGRKALLSTKVASPVPLTSAVPLSCRLLLESGAPPTDGPSLLQIEGLSKTDMLALGPEARELTIKFRILKVSRNFDNSRFVLEISPDYSRCACPPADHERLGAVRTFPILVKSKRRRPQARHPDASASSSSTSASSSTAAAYSTGGPAAVYARERSGSPDDDSSELLARILAEQARQSQWMATLAQNQAKILSLLSASGAGPVDDFELDGAEARAPPTPPGRSAFRREGTDSSTSSVGSEVTLMSAGPDAGARLLRAPQPGFHVPAGPPPLAAGYSMVHGLPSSSSAAFVASMPSAHPQRMAQLPSRSYQSGGVEQLLAAAQATESSAKRSRTDFS